MKTKHYLSKKFTYSLFGQKYYHIIKAKKILFDYLIGKDYDDIYKHISKILKEDDIILDIGANMGQYLSRLSKLNKKGKIISIEPVSENLKALNFMKNILRIKNAIIIDKAISDSPGLATLIIPRLNGIPITTQASLLNDTQFKESDKYEINVKTTTIDQIVNSLSLQKINFIKVDTEGFDSVVLKSGIKSIKKFMPLIKVEENCFKPEMKWLFEIGYKAFKFNIQKVVLINNFEDNIKYMNDTYLASKERLQEILYIYNK